LALGHFTCGLFLLSLATWFGISAIWVLPHMSTGTIWTNLPIVLYLAAVKTIPLGALSVWMGVLGRWTWIGHATLRVALLWTHSILLVPGIAATAIGIWWMHRAAESAARGGGLMSGLWVFPFSIGVSVVALALLSIIFATTAIHPRATQA
jgi:hypothetical protein